MRRFSKKYFKKIEDALGFKLYDWQIAYIRGDSDCLQAGRCNGKTLAFALRQLLNYEVRVEVPNNIDDFYKLIVCDRGEPRTYVNNWFFRFVYELALKLDNTGIETMFIFEKENTK